jgi:dethiobiotin synthetase
MTIKYFITGTDTEVGKTYISVELLNAFREMGLSTLGLKPIASGIAFNETIPSDTKLLHEASSLKLSTNEITPFAFREAIAPHIASEKAGNRLSVAKINRAYEHVLNVPVDVCLIEGFGGWFAPLNEVETMADFVTHHRFNVILVVGLRVGCINHAILTQKAMAQSQVNVVGWIANNVSLEMMYCEENILALKKHLPIPYLGNVTHLGKLDISAITTDKILSNHSRA